MVSIRLLMSVNIALSPPGVLPKKSGVYPMSSSNPNTPPMLPSETPNVVRLSSQFVRLAQFDESPPKLKPMNGAMNPSARAGVATPARTAEVAHAMKKGRMLGMRCIIARRSRSRKSEVSRQKSEVGQTALPDFRPQTSDLLDSRSPARDPVEVLREML